LEANTPYPITRAKRINTKYGLEIVLTLQGPDDGEVQVFLPQRYSDVMTESDLGELALGVYYFAKVKSPLLDHFYLSDPYFHVGAFSFAIRESVEHDENADYYVYQITLG